MRIVSLLPSATEIVVALGHAPELVGRSAECDFPPAIRHREVVMRPRVQDFERSSAEIDERVRGARQREESLYTMDVEALRRLQPELILTQDLCGVCSVTGDEVRSACEEAGVHPRVVSLTPRRLAEVWESVRVVADALGDRRAGDVLASHLEHRARSRPELSGSPRVCVVEWLDPPILAGLWVPEMVMAAGGEPLGPKPGEPGERTTWSAIGESKPDLVVLSPCSFSVDRTRREIDHGGLDPSLSALDPRRGLWLADEAYFSRPGPRLADGIDLLRARLWDEPYTPPMPARPWVPEGA